MTTPALPAPDDFPINSYAPSSKRPVEEQAHVTSDDASRRSHYAILVDASSLPEEAGKLILQTVRQTRLTPGEQGCVAEELIAHFADGLEAEVSLDDLIGQFGDTKTTATLIRRAKERCCPKPRFANAAAQLGLGLIIATAIGSAWFMLYFIAPKLQ